MGSRVKRGKLTGRLDLILRRSDPFLKCVCGPEEEAAPKHTGIREGPTRIVWRPREGVFGAPLGLIFVKRHVGPSHGTGSDYSNMTDTPLGAGCCAARLGKRGQADMFPVLGSIGGKSPT